MKAPAALTRKLGPAPVWAWAAVALVGAYIVHRRRTSAPATTSTAVPVGASTTGFDTGAVGSSSSPTDSGNSDLLSSLLGNNNAYQQLIAALQGGDVGVGTGGAPGGGPTGSFGGVPIQPASAPAPLDSGVNNAPTDPYAAAVASAKTTTPDYSLVAQEIPLSGADQGYALENAVLSNPATDYSALTAALGIPTIPQVQAQLDAYANSIPTPTSTQVAGPTPTTVQPAPVDTSSLMPRPTVGAAVAV